MKRRKWKEEGGRRRQKSREHWYSGMEVTRTRRLPGVGEEEGSQQEKTIWSRRRGR